MNSTFSRVFSRDGIGKSIKAYSNPIGAVALTMVAMFLLVMYIPIILLLLFITGLGWLGLTACYVCIKNIMCLFLSFTEEETEQFKGAYFKVIDRHLTRVTKKSDDFLGI
tara:strand:- start:2484 stop:2813 length:330 start_codon:yes stop_codon:yes gene_type:complete